mmetsp:Transcript_12094/g.35303  ORF Transcript_12094/g.35303 Transcript_12094/m.35303 type:complete len:189 (-) Transcript_12094:275-841(-)
MIYLASNCAKHREEAFDLLSEVGRSPAYYGGKCKGNNSTNILKTPDGEVSPRYTNGTTKHSPWKENYQIFSNYRFCLVLENRHIEWYMSEKIIMGFLGGCVPIYWGASQIFDVFNEKSFVWYNIDDPYPALDRLAYLERNRSAYEEVLAEPILANGERTIEQYFSYSESVGKGILRGRIRRMMGLHAS